MDEAKLRSTAESIERATKAQAQLIDDLLDISRIVTGKLKMELQAVDLAAVGKLPSTRLAPLPKRNTWRFSSSSMSRCRPYRVTQRGSSRWSRTC